MVPASTHGDDVSSGCDFLLSPTLIISPSIAKLVTQAVNSTEVSRLLLLLFKHLRKQTKIDGQTKPKRCRICSLQVLNSLQPILTCSFFCLGNTILFGKVPSVDANGNFTLLVASPSFCRYRRSPSSTKSCRESPCLLNVIQ